MSADDSGPNSFGVEVYCKPLYWYQAVRQIEWLVWGTKGPKGRTLDTPERLAIAAQKYFKDKEAKEESWREKLSHNSENSLSQKQNKKQNN